MLPLHAFVPVLALMAAQDAAPPAVTPAVDFSEADRLLFDGPDERANYEKALKLYEAVVDPPPALLAREAQAWLRIGDLEKDDDKKLGIYKRGQAAADAGLAKDAKCADCWFWHGATLGRWGQTRGVLQSLFILDDVKQSFQKALAAD